MQRLLTKVRALRVRVTRPVPKGYHRIFTYGPLKRGFYNAPGLGKEARWVAEREQVAGFGLYSLGSYPGAVRALGEEGFIIGEVVDVVADTFQRLDRMERGAGYEPRTVVTAGGYEATMWEYMRYSIGRNDSARFVGSEWTLDHQNARREFPY